MKQEPSFGPVDPAALPPPPIVEPVSPAKKKRTWKFWAFWGFMFYVFVYHGLAFAIINGFWRGLTGQYSIMSSRPSTFSPIPVEVFNGERKATLGEVARWTREFIEMLKTDDGREATGEEFIVNMLKAAEKADQARAQAEAAAKAQREKAKAP